MRIAFHVSSELNQSDYLNMFMSTIITTGIKHKTFPSLSFHAPQPQNLLLLVAI